MSFHVWFHNNLDPSECWAKSCRRAEGTVVVITMRFHSKDWYALLTTVLLLNIMKMLSFFLPCDFRILTAEAETEFNRIQPILRWENNDIFTIVVETKI